MRTLKSCGWCICAGSCNFLSARYAPWSPRRRYSGRPCWTARSTACYSAAARPRTACSRPSSCATAAGPAARRKARTARPPAGGTGCSNLTISTKKQVPLPGHGGDTCFYGSWWIREPRPCQQSTGLLAPACGRDGLFESHHLNQKTSTPAGTRRGYLFLWELVDSRAAPLPTVHWTVGPRLRAGRAVRISPSQPKNKYPCRDTAGVLVFMGAGGFEPPKH